MPMHRTGRTLRLSYTDATAPAKPLPYEHAQLALPCSCRSPMQEGALPPTRNSLAPHLPPPPALPLRSLLHCTHLARARASQPLAPPPPPIPPNVPTTATCIPAAAPVPAPLPRGPTIALPPAPTSGPSPPGERHLHPCARPRSRPWPHRLTPPAPPPPSVTSPLFPPSSPNLTWRVHLHPRRRQRRPRGPLRHVRRQVAAAGHLAPGDGRGSGGLGGRTTYEGAGATDRR